MVYGGGKIGMMGIIADTILKKNEYYLTKASPGGFHYSTIGDLFNFSKALRNYTLLKKGTTDLMYFLDPKTTSKLR